METMSKNRSLICLAVMLVVVLLLSACDQDRSVEVIVALTQTAAAQEEAAGAEEAAEQKVSVSGSINGRDAILLPMVVYAIESDTHEWASVEIQGGSSEEAFSLQVSPGSYYLYAYPVEERSSLYAAFLSDEATPGILNLEDGQDVSGIVLDIPTFGQCSSSFYLPASPDGRFAATGILDEVCKAQLPSAAGELVVASGNETSLSGVVRDESRALPPMAIYAIDFDNNRWQYVELPGGSSEISFTIMVQPGGYHIYAYSLIEGDAYYAAYQSENLTPGSIAIGENQLISHIVVRPPSQTESGVMFAAPGTPDGRFAAIDNPYAASAPSATSQSTSDSGYMDPLGGQRIQFAAGATSARVEGTIQPNTCMLYVLGAQQGQRMDVRLVPWGSVSLASWGMDGTDVLRADEGVNEIHAAALPVTQDYYLEVCSLKESEGVPFTLDVDIPPLGS